MKMVAEMLVLHIVKRSRLKGTCVDKTVEYSCNFRLIKIAK